MKNIFRNALGLFFVLVCFSCSQNGKEGKNATEPTFSSQKIANPLLLELAGAHDDRFIALEGNFKLSKYKERQIALYSQTKDNRHVFILDAVDKGLNITDSISKVVYLKNGILLNDSLFVAVKENLGDRVLENVEQLSKKGIIKKQLQIKILLHKWYSVKKFSAKEFPIMALIKRKFVVEEASNSEGAIYCGYSYKDYGCMVSCGAGFYADCESHLVGEPDCQCKKKKEK